MRPRYLALCRRARHVVGRTLRALPADVRKRALTVPILLRRAPSPALLAGDPELTPDLLGLFCGTPYGDELNADVAMPAQIFLFLENIWESAPDWRGFSREVRITLLHELGHYLNLSEDDLRRRGLE